VGRVAQAEVALQLRGGKPDVDAIQVGDDVAQEEERHQPPQDAVDGAARERVGDDGRLLNAHRTRYPTTRHMNVYAVPPLPRRHDAPRTHDFTPAHPTV